MRIVRDGVPVTLTPEQKLQNAIDIAADNGTVILSENVTMNVNLTKLVNLNLNDKTITGHVTINSVTPGTLKISTGTITGNLTVDAKNATINNNATVRGTINIKDVSNTTWNELVSGNELVFNAEGKTLHIPDGVIAKGLTINVPATIISPNKLNAVVKKDVEVTVKDKAADKGIVITGTGNAIDLEPKEDPIEEAIAIEDAELVLDGKALLVKFSINKEIDLSKGANVVLEYFKDEAAMKNSMAGDSDLVKDKKWAGYLANVNAPAKNYSSGAEDNISYSNEIPADTLIGSKVQRGYHDPEADMNYVEIADFASTPGVYEVKITVTDNTGVTASKTVTVTVK